MNPLRRKLVLPVLLSVLLCTLPTLVSAHGHQNYDPPPGLPKACYVLFRTRAAAQRHCPPGVRAVEAFDFWNQKFLGWQCRCEKP